ncbi:hypothetical protein AB3S75_012106 [Citrus x aurantiifolia]
MDSFDESNCDTSLDMEPKRKKRRIGNNDDGGGEDELIRRRQSNDDDDSRNVAYREVTKRWRTDKEQQIYSSKLLQAVRHVRRRSSSARTGEAIRETADRLLAVSAKGATRWSRAILSSPPSLRLKKRQVKVRVTGCSRLRRKPEEAMRRKNKLPPVQKKLRVLGRMIPGCRKVSSLNLLEEATDYISALEMQVRAMTALTAILAG